jgi:outer membrane protein OmpA-like peptidoglycan-associated protein
MNRIAVFGLAALLSLSFTVGCSSKKYVRSQTGPVINKTNELDEITAKNTNAIKDVDQRAQSGIQQANQAAAAADQKAVAAGQSADSAQGAATQAMNRVTSLSNTVVNLDNYRPVAETTVHFGIDKSNLTPKARKALDELGGELQNQQHYILVVDGNTDSTGSADYNYALSQRRADNVIQYIASKYNVPPHKIFVIGLGKDKPAEPNRTAQGRAENRRVSVRLMSNAEGAPAAAQATQPPQ